MDVGDLVIRSYAWPELVPGIIVSAQENKVNGHVEYYECVFTIAWSDGSISEELDLEVEHIEDILLSEEDTTRNVRGKKDGEKV